MCFFNEFTYPEKKNKKRSLVLHETPSVLFLVGIQYLNTNHTLYDAVKKAEQDGNLLPKEAHRAAHHLRVDFEKGGIHLCAGLYFVTVDFQFCHCSVFLFQKISILVLLCRKIRPS